MSVVLPIGVAAVCFILAWISFDKGDSGTGWIFAVIGVVVFVLGVVLGNRNQ